MDVQSAIEALIGDREPGYRYERAFAALAFSAWINWPKDRFAAANLVLVGITQALLRGKEGSGEWLPRALEPEQYWTQFGAERPAGISLPIHEEVRGEWGYDESRYVADVVRFLLTYKTRSADKRMRASLGRASEYINKRGGFANRGDGIGKRTREWSTAKHQTVWTTYKRIAAFQFVRYYDSEIDWLFNPQDPSVLIRAMEVVEDRSKLLVYFGRVLWVQTKLIALLDPRSMSPSDHVVLPTALKPVPCRLPRAPKNFYEVTGRYQRNRAEPDGAPDG